MNLLMMHPPPPVSRYNSVFSSDITCFCFRCLRLNLHRQQKVILLDGRNMILLIYV